MHLKHARLPIPPPELGTAEYIDVFLLPVKNFFEAEPCKLKTAQIVRICAVQGYEKNFTHVRVYCVCAKLWCC